MGLCAPAAVATHTTLEGCAPHDGFAVVPGQFVEVPGVFQLMGCIRQGGEDHAGITLKADARNATGHFGAVYPGAASAFLRIDRAVLGKICPNVVIPCTHLNTDLANGESKIWILDDPEGFEQAYGALSEKLGAEWQTKLIPWRSQPALSGLELGSYNTAADGSQTVDIQSRFAGYSVAVFDASDALWQALNS